MEASAVNTLVKFTEVFIRNDVMNDGGSSGAKQCQNTKKYFHSDDEDGDIGATDESDGLGKVDSMESDRGYLVEAVELSQQMDAMGLPVSFMSSKKQTTRSHKGRRKGDQKCLHNYTSYAEALAGRFRVSTVNINKPQFAHLESDDGKGFLCERLADNVSNPHPLLTKCFEDMTHVERFYSGTALSNPATPGTHVYYTKESDEDGSHECVEASSTDDNLGITDQLSGGAELPLEASTLSSDMTKDVEMIDHNCYGEFKEWRMYWDNGYQRYYYFNINTHQSTWEPPLGMEHQLPHNIENGMENSGGPAPDDTINNELMGTDQFQHHTTNSFDLDPYCLEDGHKDSHGTNVNACGRSLCAGCLVLMKEILEKHVQESPASQDRRVTKSRTRRTSSVIIEDDVTKYWRQRYHLFSKFDDGIKMDEEGWYSVTPEQIAKHHASRCGTGVVLDLFTGVGGNAIQFAQRSNHVIAVDIDPSKIEYAKHNAAIYGVDGWIDFIEGNSFDIAPKLKADTVFLSPPWGGPEYAKKAVYDLKTMLRPHDGYHLFNTVKHVAPHIVMFLPRNVDTDQLIELAVSSTPPWSLEVEKNYLNGSFKAITAYFSSSEETQINYSSKDCH